MKNRTVILSTALCLAPILLGVSMYGQLPDMVPTHFDMNGVPDGWSSRPVAVFGMPLFLAAVNLLCHWGMKKALQRDDRKVAPDVLINMVGWIVGIISVIVVPMSLFMAVGVDVPISFVMNILLAVVFLVVGNYLPKCKMNAYIGIKLPWTYSSEENWRRTHRLGGFVWVAAGLLLLGNLVFNSELLLMLLILGAILIPGVYSYCLYRNETA